MERIIDANYINEAAFIKAFNQVVIENKRRDIRTLRINRKSSIDLDDLYQYPQIEISW